MILDRKGKNEKRNEELNQNIWIRRLLLVRSAPWYKRWWEKRKFKKDILKFHPSVYGLGTIAHAIQILAKNFYFPNDGSKKITSWYDSIRELNVICLQEECIITKIEIYDLYNSNKNTTISMTVINNDEKVFNRKWDQSTIDNVIKNDYEEYEFAHIIKYLIESFSEALLSYI